MAKLLKNHSLLLILFTVVSTLSLWLIFYFNLPQYVGFPASSLETVYSNYDGPNYLVISKCGYQKDCIGPNYSLPQPLEYYPAHLPGYPVIIRFFDLFTSGTKAMLFSTLLGSIFLSLSSYHFFQIFFNRQRAFILSLLLLFIPPRLFILRSIGAPETWFIGAILTSIIFFKKDRIWLSAIFAAFAQSLKTPGILLTLSYAIITIHQIISHKVTLKKIIIKYYPYLLTPITILLIFYSYFLQTGDFLAYFHSGDNFHLNLFPYLVFVSNNTWVDSIWLEEIVYIYFLSIYGVYRLIKKLKFNIISIFPAVFLIATLLVSHRDISRYIAPVYPFLFLAFGKKLYSKPVVIIFLIILPAIFLYAINFIIGNTAPIADWANYL
jgi:hypothetical protein